MDIVLSLHGRTATAIILYYTLVGLWGLWLGIRGSGPTPSFIGAWVMVVSARVGSQRTAQQIAGFVLGGLVVALSAIGGLLQGVPAEVVIGVVVAILVSDLLALELARRLWNREEAVARL